MKQFFSYLIIWLCLIGLTAGIVLVIVFFPKAEDVRIEMNGKEVAAGADLGALSPETTFTVRGLKEYEVAVMAAPSDREAAFYVLEEKYEWNDIEGRDMTPGFEIARTDEGFVLGYDGAERVSAILTAALGLSCRADHSTNAVVTFRFTLTVGRQAFSFSVTDEEYTLTLSPGNIVF